MVCLGEFAWTNYNSCPYITIAELHNLLIFNYDSKSFLSFPQLIVKFKVYKITKIHHFKI